MQYNILIYEGRILGLMYNKDIDDDEMSVVLQYPYNDKYYYTTELERIDIDKAKEESIKSGRGFIISAPQSIKKEVMNQDGIFSSRYGSNSISDVDSFNGKYRCKCGTLRGSIRLGDYCEYCNSRVAYVQDDVSIKGYISVKDEYCLIHPNLYRSLAAFIGETKLNNIIRPIINVDIDGNVINDDIKFKKGNDQPFKGIGILRFRDNFDMIMEYYKRKNPGKIAYYNDIMAHKNIVFNHTVSVYSSLLRPSKLDNGSLRYEKCNEHFKMISNLVYRINSNAREIDKKSKEKLELLYNTQEQINIIYLELKEILSKKKGDIRSAVGGRYSFSERSVIRQDPMLKPDQIKLPFHGLCELLQQVIINILVKTYNFTYADAHKKWRRAQITGDDPVVYGIIDGLIKDNPDGGLPVLINRNPTISYGGILFVRCVGINMDFTMSISLLVLKVLGADFDGDTLNILYLFNQQFIKTAEHILSPRYMFISRNDGTCNADFIHSRDVIINANALKNLGEYTPEELEDIKRLQSID